MARTVNGRLVAAPDKPIGDALVVDHPAGAVVLEVADTFGFDEAGGLLRIGAEQVAYTGYDDDDATIFLDLPTTLDHPAGEEVIRLPEVSEKTVLVRIADDSGSREVAVRAPFYMHPMIDEAIRTSVEEPYARLREIDGDYELVDIWGIPKSVDAGALTGILPPEVSVPGIPDAPPDDAPVVVAAPLGVGAVRASWDAVVDATEYHVYASWEPGIDVVAATSVGTVSGTQFDVLEADGQPLLAGKEDEDIPPVYVRVVPANLLGDGPASIEVSATPRKADVAELNVGQLNAYTIEAIVAILSSLDVDIVTVAGRIVVGPESAAHLVIDPATGLTLYGPDGQTVVVKLDMTAEQLNEFVGRVIASKVTTDELELRGLVSKMVSNSRLTLAATIDNPSSKPTLTTALGSRPWLAPPANYVEYGMWWESSTGLWWQLLWRAETNRAAVRAIAADGTQDGATITLVNDVPGGVRVSLPAGIVKVGTDFFVLRRGTAGDVGQRQWHLIRYSGTGGSLVRETVGDENDSGAVGAYPSLSYDGTRLVIGSLNATTFRFAAASGKSGFVRYSTTMAYVDQGTITGNMGDGLISRGCGITTLPEHGGQRFWIANSQRCYVWTVSGSTIVLDTLGGIWDLEGATTVLAHDGTNFHSSVGSNTLKAFSNWLDVTGDERRVWAQQAWENGSSATLPSPAESIIVPDRRYLTIGLAVPTSGTTTSRVFTGRGATQPANAAMYSRGTTTALSMQVESHAASGDNPRTASDFSSGTPAEIVSQDGGFRLAGDGTMTAPRKLQAGVDVPIPAGTGGFSVAVTFPTPFLVTPAVVVTPSDVALTNPRVFNKTSAGFTVRVDRATAGTYTIDWTAVAP